MRQIGNLDKRKMDNAEHIKKLGDEKKNLETEIQETTMKKKEHIEKLKTRINDMSADFASMLKETLENMKKKI